MINAAAGAAAAYLVVMPLITWALVLFFGYPEPPPGLMVSWMIFNAALLIAALFALMTLWEKCDKNRKTSEAVDVAVTYIIGKLNKFCPLVEVKPTKPITRP